LQVNGHRLSRARTFSDVGRGQGFWYENANGLAEIAVNRASAVQLLDIKLGDEVTIVQS
jgi:S-adenosylmethionine hydrolase